MIIRPPQQGVCDQHPFDPTLRNCRNNTQLPDHWRMPRLERGETFLGYFCWIPSRVDTFLVDFWFEATQVFQFLWPTAIEQMDTDVTTNVTTSQVATTNQAQPLTNDISNHCH